MNKIKLVSGKILEKDIDNSIIIKEEKKSIIITIPQNNNTNLELSFEGNNTYNDISIIIDDNSTLSLVEYKEKNIDREYRYQYVLKDNSELIINKFNSIDTIREDIEINLDGINSKVTYNLATITNYHQQYIMRVRHNNQNTISYITNHGITLDNAKLELDISGIVPKYMKNSILNQDNKIITMGDNNSIIKPNLLIDEYEVSARHGASIGKFDDSSLFYLQTRGLTKENSYQLLIKGFLLGILKIDDKLKSMFEREINKFGR